MLRVRLLHWNSEAAAEMRDGLIRAGFQVDYDATFDSGTMGICRADPPGAFLIDLSRLPSRGREIAIAIRQSPKIRQVPIVFCDGEAVKVRSIREVLPDATYCKTAELADALRSSKPPSSPVKPADMMNRYGARTVAQKLGIKEGDRVAIIDPPANAIKMLGEMPGGVEFAEDGGQVTVCFVHSIDGLRADMSRVRGLAAKTKLWFLWRKKSAPKNDGLTDGLVRETGIELGLVDYKICSIDGTWTAMLFARKK